MRRRYFCALTNLKFQFMFFITCLLAQAMLIGRCCRHNPNESLSHQSRVPQPLSIFVCLLERWSGLYTLLCSSLCLLGRLFCPNALGITLLVYI